MSQSKLMSFFSSATEKRKRDSDDFDEWQPGPSTPKKTSRPRGFCNDWLVKYDHVYVIYVYNIIDIVQFYILFSVNRLNSNKTK